MDFLAEGPAGMNTRKQKNTENASGTVQSVCIGAFFS